MTGGPIPLVDLKAQYRSIAGEVAAAIEQVLESADFVLGEEVAAFEAEFAAYCQAEHAVGLDSGISALELGLRALGIGPGDEVLTPVNSFIASSSSISFTGAVPVWVDCDPDTYNLDLAAARKAVTRRTRAIMPVHLYGRPADMDGVLGLAREHGLKVIEDACQAHGARYRGRRVGSFGDAAAFSFYPGKNLGGYGDGGALTTGDARLAERVREMRNYGQRRKYEHVDLAWNRRLDTIQAAVLRVKLRHLDDWNAARRRHAAVYGELLADRVAKLPAGGTGEEHVHHLYVVEVAERDALLGFLRRQGIAAGLHYPIPIHRQPAYQDRACEPGSFPVSEAVAARLLSLPMYPELAPEQLERVCTTISQFRASTPAIIA